MKQAPEKLRKLIEPTIIGLGYECVGIEFNSRQGHGVLRIYIDSPRGVALEDCSKISHQISGVLDVADPIAEGYQLEISSPGSDRPIFNIQQFSQFIGSTVTVNLFIPVAKRRKITGQIARVAGDIVTITTDDLEVECPLQSISKARLTPPAINQREQNGK